MRKGYSPKLDETQGFQCLGHSNWTICCLLSWFCPQIVSSFEHASPEKGKAENEEKEFTQTGWNTGVSVPGAFKLDPLLPINMILSHKISIFWTCLMMSPIINPICQFLIPQRKGRQKMRKGNSPKLDETQGFQCLGHSNWTICCLLSWFCPQIVSSFEHASHNKPNMPILITPEKGKAENEKREFTQTGWDIGVSVLGAFILWTICCLLRWPKRDDKSVVSFPPLLPCNSGFWSLKPEPSDNVQVHYWEGRSKLANAAICHCGGSQFDMYVGTASQQHNRFQGYKLHL